MPETFLILLAGGVLLAAALSDPKQVTPHWLRLAGIIALCMTGLSAYFYATRDAAADTPAFFRRIQLGLLVTTALAVLGQLAFAQLAMRRTQRLLAAGAFLLAVLAGSNFLHDAMLVRYAPPAPPLNLLPKPAHLAVQAAACAGVAAAAGLALMTMLLGHAYLTASAMTQAPFARLNLALAATLVLRALMNGGALLLHHYKPPVIMFWGQYGLLMLTRWLVGLAVPAVFVYMAHDCIRRRSNQSATGILYVTGLLVFLGELTALYLVRGTGLPF